MWAVIRAPMRLLHAVAWVGETGYAQTMWLLGWLLWLPFGLARWLISTAWWLSTPVISTAWWLSTPVLSTVWWLSAPVLDPIVWVVSLATDVIHGICGTIGGCIHWLFPSSSLSWALESLIRGGAPAFDVACAIFRSVVGCAFVAIFVVCVLLLLLTALYHALVFAGAPRHRARVARAAAGDARAAVDIARSLAYFAPTTLHVVQNMSLLRWVCHARRLHKVDGAASCARVRRDWYLETGLTPDDERYPPLVRAAATVDVDEQTAIDMALALLQFVIDDAGAGGALCARLAYARVVLDLNERFSPFTFDERRIRGQRYAWQVANAADASEAERAAALVCAGEGHFATAMLTETSTDISLALFLEAAKLGDADACWWLGAFLMHGLVAKQAQSLGAALLVYAASKGHAAARLSLARCCSRGLGVERNVVVGWWYFFRAARLPWSESAVHCASLYHLFSQGRCRVRPDEGVKPRTWAFLVGGECDPCRVLPVESPRGPPASLRPLPLAQLVAQLEGSLSAEVLACARTTRAMAARAAAWTDDELAAARGRPAPRQPATPAAEPTDAVRRERRAPAAVKRAPAPPILPPTLVPAVGGSQPTFGWAREVAAEQVFRFGEQQGATSQAQAAASNVERQTSEAASASAGGSQAPAADSADADTPAPAPARKQKACLTCGATRGLRRCAGCRSAHFCGQECLQAAWELHKPDCKRIRETLQASDKKED